MKISGIGSGKVLEYDITTKSGDNYRGSATFFDLLLNVPLVEGEPVDGWATFKAGPLEAQYSVGHRGVFIEGHTGPDDRVLCEVNGNTCHLAITPKVGDVNVVA